MLVESKKAELSKMATFYPQVCAAINFVGDAGPGFSQADFDNMKERSVHFPYRAPFEKCWI